MMVLALAVLVSTGAIDANCTVKDVCTPDYTETVRPSENWTGNVKANLMVETNAPGQMADYELDHFIPLELCGAPRDLSNLWLEPMKEARKKDKDETYLHRLVCKGELSLEGAQDAVKARWKKHPPNE